MKQESLIKLLDELRKLPSETEWVEFKKAENNFDFNKIGKYFSGLSNEANLKNRQSGYLIFGIDDKTRNIAGTKYRVNRKDLDKLKKEIADKTNGRITFSEIHELLLPEGRVLMFQIPSACQGIPTSWEGHYYGRDGESLVPLNLNEIEQIRRQYQIEDWSKQVIDKAAVHDLLPEAIKKAREEYSKKNPSKIEEIKIWNDITFLNKAKITIQGKITNTAIILLGKPESEHLISPSAASVSWIYKNDKNIEEDYEHFGPPFILNTELIRAKIRNLKYRYLPDNTLFPVEITKYEPYVIREALHNCIAHQDYSLQSKIVLVEKSDELIFSNAGSFIPGTVEAVIEQDAPQKYYRNKFLADAMVNLNMIDTVGGGIKKMFILLKNRFFPMPTYDLHKESEVTVHLYGKVIDEKYTRILIKNTDIELTAVILLDRLQKGQKLLKQECLSLRKQKLVEGRYPNIFIASEIAAAAREKASYIRNRAFDKKHYKELILSYLEKYKEASRDDFDSLIQPKLSDTLSEKQKKIKVNNLLNEMANKDKKIENTGTIRKSKWVKT